LSLTHADTAIDDGPELVSVIDEPARGRPAYTGYDQAGTLPQRFFHGIRGRLGKDIQINVEISPAFDHKSQYGKDNHDPPRFDFIGNRRPLVSLSARAGKVLAGTVRMHAR
jgi:hypothetical protein